jgi:hypothetical protein
MPQADSDAAKPGGLAQPVAEMSEGLTGPVTGIEPGAGGWHTWVLESGSEFRLEPPPDTKTTKEELRQLRALAAQRDAAALDQISYWDSGSPSYRWIELAMNQFQTKPMPPHRANRILSLLNVAVYDATVAAWDSKYTYARRGPADLDPKLTRQSTLPTARRTHPSTPWQQEPPPRSSAMPTPMTRRASTRWPRRPAGHACWRAYPIPAT